MMGWTPQLARREKSVLLMSEPVILAAACEPCTDPSAALGLATVGGSCMGSPAASKNLQEKREIGSRESGSMNCRQMCDWICRGLINNRLSVLSETWGVTYTSCKKPKVA
jgi:hypothetical protein